MHPIQHKIKSNVEPLIFKAYFTKLVMFTISFPMMYRMNIFGERQQDPDKKWFTVKLFITPNTRLPQSFT